MQRCHHQTHPNTNLEHRRRMVCRNPIVINIGTVVVLLLFHCFVVDAQECVIHIARYVIVRQHVWTSIPGRSCIGRGPILPACGAQRGNPAEHHILHIPKRSVGPKECRERPSMHGAAGEECLEQRGELGAVEVARVGPPGAFHEGGDGIHLLMGARLIWHCVVVWWWTTCKEAGCLRRSMLSKMSV